MKPTIGRIVIYHIGANDGFRNNGAEEAPAIVVRVWNDNYINLKVLTDGPQDAWLTSVRSEDSFDGAEKLGQGYWFWPKRED